MKILLIFIGLSFLSIQAKADCIAQCESIFDSTQGTPEDRTNQYLKCTNSCPIEAGEDAGDATLTSVPGLSAIDENGSSDAESSTKKSPPSGSSKSAKESSTGSSKSNSSASKKSSDSKTKDSKDSSNREENPEEVACTENFDAEVSACESATLKAKSSCDENGTLSNSLANLASSTAELASKYSAASIQQSCSSVARYMGSVTAALAAYRQLCGSSISTCVSTCSALIKQKCKSSSASDLAAQAKAALDGNRTTCNSYSSKIAQANSTAQSYSLTQANAQLCALQTSSEGLGVYCQKNPNAEGCKQPDCNSPSMASNKVCICTKNPSDPSCIGTASTSNSNSASFASTDRRVGNSKPQGDFNTGDESNPRMSPSKPNGSDNTGTAVDGRQGGSAQLTAGEPNPSPQKRLKVKTTVDVPVLEGTYNNAGGGSSQRYAALKVDEKTSTQNTALNQPSSKKEGPDLRQFLPGGNGFQRGRGIAGSSEIIGTDGITGPHSNIWQKIRNRYMSVKDSLVP